ncbi:MAG: FHA domain-containing protein [Pirellulales bacterium]
MKIRFTSIDPWQPELELSLAGNALVVGSGEESDLRLRDRWTSRKHCTILASAGSLVVHDLGSERGTFINGRRIKHAHLKPGDDLTVGIRTFKVTFRQPESAASTDKRKCGKRAS